MSCPCCKHKAPVILDPRRIYCPDCDEVYIVPAKVA